MMRLGVTPDDLDVVQFRRYFGSHSTVSGRATARISSFIAGRFSRATLPLIPPSS
jgi:hypothetical protein